jgi:hypothetical protein
MGAPQIIALVLIGLNLLISAYLHGKPKSGKHNVFLALLNAGITIWILSSGGFFE